MGAEQSAEEINRELATAFGLYALTDATIHEAAAETDVTGWELEVAIERAGLDDVFQQEESDISETIDDLLGDH